MRGEHRCDSCIQEHLSPRHYPGCRVAPCPVLPFTSSSHLAVFICGPCFSPAVVGLEGEGPRNKLVFAIYNN